MTSAEWMRIGARIGRIWPHQLVPDETLVEWFLLLADLEAGQVNAAVSALAVDGREFPPAGGVIRAKVAELSEDGSLWGEVWAEIQRNASLYGTCDLPRMVDGELVWIDIPWSSPMVRDLVEQIGWRELCTTTDPPSVVEAQCREKWRAMRGRERQDHAYRGLPAAGLRRLERMSSVGGVLSGLPAAAPQLEARS